MFGCHSGWQSTGNGVQWAPMKALPLTEPNTAVENIIPLAIEKPKSAKAVIVDRFKIEAYQNRGGSTCWRVAGSKRDGTRIRENFSDAKAAECQESFVNKNAPYYG
jgi:hypothetical protein